MHYRVLLILLSTKCLLVSIPVADAYSTGADPGSCVSMEPTHQANTQPPPSPYSISLSSTSVKGTESVDITLTSTTHKFKGFLIQVRKPGGTNAVGHFDVAGSGGLAKTMDCAGMPAGSSATHVFNDEKTSVTVKWISPNEDDQLEVYYTAVQDKTTYWSHVIHLDKIQITKDPSKTTTTTPPPPPPHDDLLAKWREIYNGCRKNRGCFGIPAKCVDNFRPESNQPQTCTILVTWNRANEFELTGRPKNQNGYIAVGFSADEIMGHDSVVGCVSSGQPGNQNPKVQRYYNVKDAKNNKKWNDPKLGLIAIKSAVIEGNLFCEFKQLDHTINSFAVNFAKAYYYMLSRGPIVGADGLGKHPTTNDRMVSRREIRVTNYDNIEGEDDIWLVHLHGSLLLFAWIPLSSCSIFIARFFKQTRVDNLVLGWPFWLTLHVSLMLVAAFVTLSGIAAMIVYKKGVDLSPTHSILGLCVVVLMIPQVIFPFFRNYSWAPSKVVFKWTHFLLARGIQIIACACILLAADLEKTDLYNDNDSTPYRMWISLILATIFFQIIMHAGMMYHTYWSDQKLEVEPEYRNRAFHVGPLGTNGVFGEAPGTRFRHLMLLVYAAVLIVFTILLSLLVFHILP